MLQAGGEDVLPIVLVDGKLRFSVGKTSIACATAIGLARSGKTVLLVSTAPASNLDEVLGQHIDTTPTEIGQVPGLSALNVDPGRTRRSAPPRRGPGRG